MDARTDLLSDKSKQVILEAVIVNGEAKFGYSTGELYVYMPDSYTRTVFFVEDCKENGALYLALCRQATAYAKQIKGIDLVNLIEGL